MTIDLFKLAMDAGMTKRELMDEIVRLYVCSLSSTIEENGAQMIVHVVNFADYELEITARRIPAKNTSLN